MNTPVPDFYDPENSRELVACAAEAYGDATTPGRARLCRALTSPSTESESHGSIGTSGRSLTSSTADSQGSTESHPTVIESRATETRALVTQTDTDVIIAFRGTADLRNWLTDLDCNKMPLRWAAGRVHRGFNVALESVAEPLDHAIAANETRRIWVTGHSLGGALAMLFALRLQVRRRISVAGLYTFGQPRVGNAVFSQACDSILKSRAFRVVHADDVVPRVPWLLGSYRHAGHEVSYEWGMQSAESRTPHSALSTPHFQIDPSIWTTLPADLLSLYRQLSGGRLALLADHLLKSYVDLLSVPAAQEASISIPTLT